MTLEDIIKLYRVRAQDLYEPYFCDDETLAIYINEGQDEACRRAQLLLQSSGAMCQLAFDAGAELVQLDPKVIRVLRSHVNGQAVNVVPVEYMDMSHPNWQSDTVRDIPRVLISGLTTDALHLWPVPSEAGSVRLSVQRLPLKRLQGDMDKPEIRVEAHPSLVEWALYRVYGTQDADLYDPQKSEAALKKFEAEFGKKTSIRNETWVRDGAGLMPSPLA